MKIIFKNLFIAGIVVCSPFISYAREKPRIHSVEDSTLTDTLLQAREITIFYHTSQGCHPCKAAWPTVKKFAEDHPDRVQVLVVSADAAEKVEKIQEKYGLYLTPTIAFVKSKKVIARMTGAQVKDKAPELLKYALDTKYKPEVPLFPAWEKKMLIRR